MLFGLFARKHIQNLEDQALVNLAKENDSAALGELFQRYSTLVMGLCMKYMKQVEAAEDVMMEIFEQLPGKLAKGEVQNFKSWLYSVSRNECLMKLRKKTVQSSDIESAELFTANTDAEELEAVQIKEKEIEALEDAIKELKDEQRICIELFYLKKMSYDQITSETKFELKKVKSYIQNGKRNLKLILEKQK